LEDGLFDGAPKDFRLVLIRPRNFTGKSRGQPSRYRLHTHHRRFSCKSAGEVNHAIRVAATAEFFNTIGGLR
jgi:hypothetical protein